MNKVIKVIIAIVLIFGFISLMTPSSSVNNKVEQKKETKIEQKEVEKIVEVEKAIEVEQIVETPEVTEDVKVEIVETLPVKKWTTVIKLTATNNKQSETFYLLGGQQKMSYTVSSKDGDGMCTIYLMKEGEDLMTDGGFPMAMPWEDTKDETLMRKNSGYYYLDLQVGWGTCIVSIEEFK